MPTRQRCPLGHDLLKEQVVRVHGEISADFCRLCPDRQVRAQLLECFETCTAKTAPAYLLPWKFCLLDQCHLYLLSAQTDSTGTAGNAGSDDEHRGWFHVMDVPEDGIARASEGIASCTATSSMVAMKRQGKRRLILVECPSACCEMV